MLRVSSGGRVYGCNRIVRHGNNGRWEEPRVGSSVELPSRISPGIRPQGTLHITHARALVHLYLL